MGATDAVIAVLVLAGACWLLWRSFRRGGGCAGCSGGGCCSSRERGAPEPLVKLGKEPPGGR